MGCPRHDPDRRIRLRVRRLFDRLHGSVECLPSFINRQFAFAAELADTAFALRDPAPTSRHSTRPAPPRRLASRVTHAQLWTSAMLVLAKPTPAVTAKTNVIAHTAHPASEVARCRACQSLAAQEGATSATRSAATPMARNNHPAASLDPSDRANHPFMATPTPAARAAARNRIGEMLRGGASSSRATARNVTVAGGVTGGSANAESADEKPSGISDSEDGDS